MKTFLTNLTDFETSMGFSESDILELSELTSEDLDDIVKGTASKHKLYQFCLNIGIDFRSIYHDSGFKTVSLEQQYADYPNDFQKIITKYILKKLVKAYGPEEKLKRLIAANIPDKKLYTSRLFTGSSAIEPDKISLIEEALKDEVPGGYFRTLLAETMYSKIPNWNYCVARKYFNLQYQDIADALNTTTSAVSNWGGTLFTGITEDNIKIIADILGGFTYEEFTTQILTKKDLEGRKHSISLGAKLIDPPTDEKDEPVLVDEIKKRRTKPNKANKEKKKTISPVKHIADESNLSPTISLTDEKAMKLYKNLPNDDKLKVMALITELFFKNL